MLGRGNQQWREVWCRSWVERERQREEATSVHRGLPGRGEAPAVDRQRQSQRYVIRGRGRQRPRQMWRYVIRGRPCSSRERERDA